MKKTTAIEWTNHTLNFWWGCTKVSPACTHCYAEAFSKFVSKKLFGQVVEWGPGKPRFQRLEAARAEALKLNKKAADSRLIEGLTAKLDSQKLTSEGFHTVRLIQPDGTYSLHKVSRDHWSNAPQYRPRVFINSMSDWLDDEVPIEWLAYLLETLFLCPNLDFQLLTKRPENFPERMHAARMHLFTQNQHPNAAFVNWFCDWWPNPDALEPGWQPIPPPNLWIGTTVESQEWADKRLPHLLAIPAKVRFLSCEPMLSDLDLNLYDTSSWACPECGSRNVEPNHTDENEGNWWECYDCKAHEFGEPAWKSDIHWVIAGGESGGHARPSHPDWFRSLRDQCATAGIHFFFKQWGEWISVDNLKHLISEEPSLSTKYKGHRFADGTLMLRVGKDHTGRLLDGQEHSAFPSA